MAAVALLTAAGTQVSSAADTYKLLKEIPIGGDARWDYSAVDSAGRRLYVSHGTEVVVIDLDKEVVVGKITETPGVHGIAIAPELGRVFVSNGQENKASIVDAKTLQTLSKVDTGKNPDAILYEPGQKEVYTFNGRDQSATVFEAASGKVVATIPLSGKPEFAAADPKAERVYCNIEDKNEVAVIDTKTHKVVATWPIAPGEEASGLAFDMANHRLFLGCGGSKLMVMMDSTNGKVLASVPIADGVDANSFDPATQLAFASCGAGTTTIAHEEGDKLTVVQSLTTQRGCRTMTLDPQTHKIYLSAATFEPAPKQAEGGPRQRPKALPDTFKVLVYGQ